MNNELNKQEIYEETKVEFRKFYGVREWGGCFYWALTGAQTLIRHGLKPSLYAGNVSWPILQEDDGVSPTHFSYIWSPTSARSLAAMAQGYMPEVHIWLALKATGELVDFSTGEFKMIALKQGFPWRAADPPEFLWSRFLPPGVIYTPIQEATEYAMRILKENTIVVEA